MGRIYRRGNTLHAYWTDAKGNQHRRSLRTNDRDVARDRLRELEMASPDRASYAAHPLSAALDALFRSMANENAADTVESYQQKACHLVRVIGACEALGSITRDTLDGYAAIRRKEGAHPHTIHKELVVMRRAFKLAAERKVWSGDIGAIVPKIRTQYRPRERWLTHAEAGAMLAALPPYRRLWAAVALYAGLRDSEVDGLLWEHADLAGGWLRAPGTKTTGAWRMIPIAPQLGQLLTAARLELKPLPGDAVVVSWLNVRRDMPIALERGVLGKPRVRLKRGEKHPTRPKVTPNDLRRTFASWCLQAGASLLTVARMMGHSSTRMLERVYGHLSTANYQDAIAAMSAACAAGVQDGPEKDATVETVETERSAGLPTTNGQKRVPRAEVESATRGFSGPIAKVEKLRLVK